MEAQHISQDQPFLVWLTIWDTLLYYESSAEKLTINNCISLSFPRFHSLVGLKFCSFSKGRKKRDIICQWMRCVSQGSNPNTTTGSCVMGCEWSSLEQVTQTTLLIYLTLKLVKFLNSFSFVPQERKKCQKIRCSIAAFEKNF